MPKSDGRYQGILSTSNIYKLNIEAYAQIYMYGVFMCTCMLCIYPNRH